ncbi:hypothetical protein [Zavarzinella formosa]|uniref:hypothetical protein n=1 Tax=Zavarzinella formosa TaxID=360055 RepID=UPI00032002BF|nr:hypothetical protein [Zavarzinella formosa]
MPILLKCSCGRSLRVKDEAVGRRIKCPDCESVLTVPKPEEPDVVEDLEVVEDSEVEQAAPPKKPAPPPLPKKTIAIAEEAPSAKPRSRYGDREDEEKPSAKRKSRYDDDEDDEPEKPRKPKKKKKRPVQHEEQGPNPLRTILGGVASMVIAGIWFSLALAADRIYIWPPIMFVLGLIAIFRGIWEYQQNS